MKNDDENKNRIECSSVRLLEEHLTVGIVHKTLKNRWLNLGRISVDLPDELEKQLRLKTVERFGGKKGDLSRAVVDAVKTWTAKK